MQKINGTPLGNALIKYSQSQTSSLLPVKMLDSSSGTRFDVAGHIFRLNLSKLPTGMDQWLARIPATLSNASSASVITLLGLGQSTTIPLPGALANVISSKGLSIKQIIALARQGSGYLLGDAVIQSNQLKLPSLVPMPLPQHLTLTPGRYRARLTSTGEDLLLTLDEIKCELEATLDNPSALTEDTPNHFPRSTRPDVMMLALQRALNSSRVSADYEENEAQSNVAALNEDDKSRTAKSSHLSAFQPFKLRHNDNEDSAAKRRLDIALAKTGAMTQKDLPSAPLSADLSKLAALVQPLSVGSLVVPLQLKRALIEAANPNLLPICGDSSDTLQNRPMALLFQLLLGSFIKRSGIEPSALLKTWLMDLAQTTKLSDNWEFGVNRTQLAQDLANLAQARLELLQTSRDSNGWCFCLPYLLGDKQQTFEGHWSRATKQDDDPTSLQWQLRLKFNLSETELLVNAQRHSERLMLQLICSNAEMTDKIHNFLPVLSQHLAELGFENPQITAITDKVPVTLLPSGFQSIMLKA